VTDPLETSPAAEPPVSFGAAIRGLTGASASGHGLPAPFGVEVGRVTAHSPADEAGVRPGDVITDIGAYTLHGGADQFRQAISARRAGDTMKVTVWRDRHRHQLSVRFPSPSATTAAESEPAEGHSEGGSSSATGPEAG